MAISYPISLLAISAENTATTSNSLSTLSTTAIATTGTASQLIKVSPYAMSEFNGYTHSSPYSGYGPNSTIIDGSASSNSMTFWGDTTEFQNTFIPATVIAGFDTRVRVYQIYQYPGMQRYVGWSFEKNSDNAVYRNTSNAEVTMANGIQYNAHLLSAASAGSYDYMSMSTGFDEFKLVWSNTNFNITGTNTSASISQQNISGHNAIVNGTWYAIGPEGNLGTYGTTINAYISKTALSTGTGSAGSVMTIELWVRNTGLNKSETKIRSQDIYLQGDATIASGGGGGGGEGGGYSP